MAGIKDLDTLLKSMKPKLSHKTYVFCTIDESQLAILKPPILICRESEGVTVILEKEAADSENLQYEAVWAKITLTVHSDLTAIGLLAAVTNKLANAGISVNVISAYYHDHLFVSPDDTARAMELLGQF